MTRQDVKLAIHGGEPVRTHPMPARVAFGDREVARLMEAVEYYRSRELDPPYDGRYEREFCDAFCAFMGGGYADAVASGTGSCYVALAALNLPKGSEVIISPVTDSGPLNCIILQGYVPVVADAAPDSYNMGVAQFLDRVTPRTSGLFAVHCAGQPLEIDRMVAEAHRRGIKVLEDCSQAPGATWNGTKVGNFGDVAAFSTMYRKTLTAGASGGLVYARNLDIFRLALAHADRGKQPWNPDVDFRDPSGCLLPALNFNTDELSCAIGLASLARLQESIDRRKDFLRRLAKLLPQCSQVCRPYEFHEGYSPFFFPVFVDTAHLTCTKTEFARALAAEGIGLGAHYGCVVSSWSWAWQHLPGGKPETPNAESTRDRSFNLYVNERYGEAEVQDILAAIAKVEAHFLRA
jgi:dTDP-4-amino-4,6-dideoxygalactose transaminase